jgi:arsenate reductase-like glutaredoxin family protein
MEKDFLKKRYNNGNNPKIIRIAHKDLTEETLQHYWNVVVDDVDEIIDKSWNVFKRKETKNN